MQGIQTYIGLAKGVPVPDASDFDPETQYGQDWTYNKSGKTLAGLSVESALTDALKLRTAYRYGEMWREYQFVGATLTDTRGNYSEKLTKSPRQVERTHAYYALMDAEFATGAIDHSLTFGFTGTSFVYTRGNDISLTLGDWPV